MKIEHIAVYTNDLEKSKDFFTKYFNAKASEKYINSKTNFSSYFLSFEGQARIEIMNHPNFTEDRESNQIGYVHLAFSVGSREKVHELTVLLDLDGYAISSKPRITGDGYYESCILDFEGNLIEITE